MTDPAHKLRKAMQTEIERLRKEAGVESQQPKVLGAFLDAALTSTGRSRADFATRLHMELELANAILDGLLPESEIDDATLVEMALAVDFEPNLLRAMLGRKIVPTTDEHDFPKKAH